MDWIPWDETLEIGHAAIDADHRKLVKLFNQLADAVRSHKGKTVCSSILDQVVQDAIAHFDLEEQLMASRGYPKKVQHTAEHAILIREAANYRASFAADSADSHVAVINFPAEWLTRHFVTWDKELADFLAGDSLTKF